LYLTGEVWSINIDSASEYIDNGMVNYQNPFVVGVGVHTYKVYSAR